MNLPVPVPGGYLDVLKTFGDIHRYIRSDGTLSPRWEAEKIRRIKLPAPAVYAFGEDAPFITRITAHVLIAGHVAAMYREIFNAGLWSELGPYAGGFQFRANRNNGARISLHAFGIAWDWNPAEFPNGSTLKRDPALATILREFGVTLGEDFHGTPDPMHVQYCVGA